MNNLLHAGIERLQDRIMQDVFLAIRDRADNPENSDFIFNRIKEVTVICEAINIINDKPCNHSEIFDYVTDLVFQNYDDIY